MKNILVVDDDENIGEVILGYLTEGSQYNVTYASSASLAIKMLEETHFDLVITDMLMPEVNGIELTEIIFNRFPKTKVLACSGGGNSGKLVAGMVLDQALEEGADNALMKPFTEEELRTKVRNLIGV